MNLAIGQEMPISTAANTDNLLYNIYYIIYTLKKQLKFPQLFRSQISVLLRALNKSPP